MNDLRQKIITMVKDDLEAIEVALLDNLTPYLDLVHEIASHILFSGGKRLRPLLMVLSAKLCDYKGDYDKTFSTIFEFLHVATLLHDDLVDGARMRRGKTAAHLVWDNSKAVLVGDFLLARALSISVKTGRMQIIETIADITENMSQGEIQQLMRKGALDLTEAEYMDVIRRKTAILFQGACRISALIADATEEKQAALADYGYHLGLAFQMADDLLDYTIDSAGLGKEVGADLKEGKVTLPVIHALKSASAQDRDQMVTIIKNENFSINEFETLIDLLNKYEGIAYTQNLAAQHIERAKNALSVFEPSDTRDVMLDIADYTLARKV
ncbi:MAG: polyprenyl synthetase family protein [Deltaproteobacteria bacterium]|jgi:octaprenyl-diphosphate synthase|nr:polyprenyl synthetase family protein [Deltaproteobacteria bacterium]